MEVTVANEELEKAENATREAKAVALAVSSMTIETAENYGVAVDCLKEIKTKYTDLESQRHAITQPLMKAKQNVDKLFKPALTSLKSAELSMKKSMGNYQQRQEELRIRELEKAAIASKEGEEAEVVQEILIKAAEHQKATSAVNGVTVRKTKKFEVTDESKLPRHLLVPDMSKIRKAVMSGAEIPGVLIWEEPTIMARTK